MLWDAADNENVFEKLVEIYGNGPKQTRGVLLEALTPKRAVQLSLWYLQHQDITAAQAWVDCAKEDPDGSVLNLKEIIKAIKEEEERLRKQKEAEEAERLRREREQQEKLRLQKQKEAKETERLRKEREQQRLLQQKKTEQERLREEQMRKEQEQQRKELLWWIIKVCAVLLAITVLMALGWGCVVIPAIIVWCFYLCSK